MPDEITLQDILEKQIRLEIALEKVLEALCNIEAELVTPDEEPDEEENNADKGTNAFLDPDTGLYSYQYYKNRHLKKEEV